MVEKMICVSTLGSEWKAVWKIYILILCYGAFHLQFLALQKIIGVSVSKSKSYSLCVTGCDLYSIACC